MMGWGQAQQSSATQLPAEDTQYGREYYANLLTQRREHHFPIRISAVGKENTCKSSLLTEMALSITDKEVAIIDVDNSAAQSILVNYPHEMHRIRIISVFDESDASLFNEDNTTNWVALVEKMAWYIRLIGEEVANGNIGAVILDGCSTFLKWCEFSMTEVLLKRGIIKEEGERFNQAEWRVRNQLYRDVINRAHQLQVPFVGYTFHLKDVKEWMDVGGGQKGLMKVGETPEWEAGTKRLFSQQIWLTRFSKEGDIAAGVAADNTLEENEWVVRATINEMKGMNQEHLGTTHDVLKVSNGNAEWFGLPFLKWGESNGEEGETPQPLRQEVDN
tara:strand:+ start:9406 stop:10401 length:996 start_codon:yes stop_codon:yes gene_type:complete